MNRALQVMLCGVVAIVVATGVGGCGKKEEAKESVMKPSTSPASDGAPRAPVAVPNKLGIDDVEVKVKPQVTLAPGQDESVLVETQMENSKYEIVISNIAVYEPYPKSIEVKVDLHIEERFKDNPVALRGTVYNEKAVVGTFTDVVGATPHARPHEWTFDVMPGITKDPMPQTVLIHAEVEALMMPDGTDEATLDPATATATELMTTKLISNPARITFNKGPKPADGADAPRYPWEHE